MYKLKVQGIVQGVGFRPFIFRLAKELALKGYVLNSSSGVDIEIEGKNGLLQTFLERMQRELPTAARIDRVEIDEKADRGFKDFYIRESTEDKGSTLISPDLGTCNECVNELRNSKDRRYCYPFINCTNCGPRYSIIYKTPYDRVHTTMKDFKMCVDCEDEFHRPLNRRFHAQPNACQLCGPKFFLTDNKGNIIGGNPVQKAKEFILDGKIVGIKGIGGFHIAADPRENITIRELRRRKNRPDKPFAVMVSPKEVENLVVVSHLPILNSPPAPIILLPKKQPFPLSDLIAPNNPYLGIFFPYAPIHHLLLNDDLPYLIMTSGNLADEPIATDEKELGQLCDYYLTNNRPIANRADDSIIYPTALGPTIIRRSRGYVPDPIDLPVETIPTLGCGGELKGTFALSKGKFIYLSPHLGDVESKKTMDFLKESLSKFKNWFKIEPKIVACDLHPDYLTTRFAERLDLPLLKIQHHHAHIASVLVDNYCDKEVIGIAYDGTGYGTDGKIWGCEIMTCDLETFNRHYHLRYLPLPGGDAAIKRPIRIALAYLLWADEDTSILRISKTEEKIVSRQLETGFNVVKTSSLGRLFDSVSAMIGLFDEITFEAQAAMGLEYLAYDIETEWIYPYNISDMIIDPFPILKAIVEDIKRGIDRKVIARRFHNTVIEFTREVVTTVSKKTDLKTVALSGGVFQNRIILDGVANTLSEAGFEVLTHHKLPPNDGCVSAGQVAIANVSRSSG